MKSNNGSSGTFGSAFNTAVLNLTGADNKGITGGDIIYATYTSANSVKY